MDLEKRQKTDKKKDKKKHSVHKQRRILYMPIESDEQAFAAICSILDIEQIYEIILVSDDQIRSACSVQLAEILIKLKEDTIKEAVNRLA